jgi:FKBP-type peptidyl-prolyl cis-trans isomerase FkpA
VICVTPYRRLIVTVVSALALAAAACTGSSTSPSGAPFSQTDLRTGSGTTAAAGKSISVNYTGWLYDASRTDSKGLQFDTSIGKSAFTFTLGSGQVIAGWDQGLVGMQVGGLRRLVIPPSLGYGATRSGAIPPNSTLVFDVELLSVQ